jgi:hypothetical protein
MPNKEMLRKQFYKFSIAFGLLVNFCCFHDPTRFRSGEPRSSDGTVKSPSKGKSETAWKTPIYRGLTLGKASRAKVEELLGRPKWSGQPEESVFEAEPTSELWYEYEGAEGAPGRTTIVMNNRNVVVAVLVSLKEPISWGKAIERYGSKYVERSGLLVGNIVRRKTKGRL